MNITYEKNGDYLIPNLISDPETLSERTSERYLSGDAIKWKTKGTFAYDAGTGRGAV